MTSHGIDKMSEGTPTHDATELALLDIYVRHVPPPVLPDDALDAWGELYQSEKALRDSVHFDVFASDPVRFCLRAGVAPRPFDVGALPGDDGHRRPLREQRLVAGRVA